ncbi:MAG: hypothetical protein M3N29_09960 [Chloroflexota bacterium]|nr:hypothetical protein [Chloroflexota bacterium]
MTAAARRAVRTAARVIGGAVDVGSNSVHLLVADVDQQGTRPLRDPSALLRWAIRRGP